MTFVVVVVLAIAVVVLILWNIYMQHKLGSAPAELAQLRSNIAVADQALAVEKKTRAEERTSYEAKLERARALRTECENAWVTNAPPAAVLDHLRGLDSELQPVHQDGGQGGAGAGGSAGTVPSGTTPAAPAVR